SRAAGLPAGERWCVPSGPTTVSGENPTYRSCAVEPIRIVALRLRSCGCPAWRSGRSVLGGLALAVLLLPARQSRLAAQGPVLPDLRSALARPCAPMDLGGDSEVLLQRGARLSRMLEGGDDTWERHLQLACVRAA